MDRWQAYLKNAALVLQQYKGEEPFNSYLKKYFAADKKYGSADRKNISHLCYCYFRAGRLFRDLQMEERVLAGLYLCTFVPIELLEQLQPHFNSQCNLSFQEKCGILETEFQSSTICTSDQIFPFTEAISEGIDKEQFCLSHLDQPDLFIRIRPGAGETVKAKLTSAGIEYKPLREDCLALPNASRADAILALDQEAVVQDYSSQKTGDLLKELKLDTASAWDVCAGSGGKSIMLVDIFPGIQLTVTDRRESIMVNLNKRFRRAGIRRYKSFVADIASTTGWPGQETFDLLIADVPCSGSGTWGRTPEQLVFFKENKVDDYANLQKSIADRSIPHLKAGGYLLYVTCSVFKKENEAIAEHILKTTNLELLRSGIIAGYGMKADTMYAALFRKPLLL